jgi:hypothetical protein
VKLAVLALVLALGGAAERPLPYASDGEGSLDV